MHASSPRPAGLPWLCAAAAVIGAAIAFTAATRCSEPADRAVPSAAVVVAVAPAVPERRADHAPAAPSARSSTDTSPPAADDRPSSPPETPCDAPGVDHLLAQAENQYEAGFAEPALHLLLEALKCTQSVRMYRLGGFYACAAHDAAHAARFYHLVPAQYQVGILQRCMQESVTIR